MADSFWPIGNLRAIKTVSQEYKIISWNSTIHMALLTSHDTLPSLLSALLTSAE